MVEGLSCSHLKTVEPFRAYDYLSSTIISHRRSSSSSSSFPLLRVYVLNNSVLSLLPIICTSFIFYLNAKSCLDVSFALLSIVSFPAPEVSHVQADRQESRTRFWKANEEGAHLSLPFYTDDRYSLLMLILQDQCYDNLRVSTNAWDSNLVKVRANRQLHGHIDYFFFVIIF